MEHLRISHKPLRLVTSASISDNGTHALMGRGNGFTYSNDDFNGVGTWVTPAAGGAACDVTAVSPASGGGGYRVYYGFSPATPFVVSGAGFICGRWLP